MTQFLESYRDHGSSLAQHSIVSVTLSEHEAVSVAFHLPIVKPLARRYTNSALANLAGETLEMIP